MMTVDKDQFGFSGDFGISNELAENQKDFHSLDAKTWKIITSNTGPNFNLEKFSAEDTANYLNRWHLYNINGAFANGNYKTIPIKERKVYGDTVYGAFVNAGLEEIDRFSAPYAEKAGNAFKDNTKLKTVGDIDLRSATDITSLFQGCTNLESLNSINMSSIASKDKMANAFSDTKIKTMNIIANKTLANTLTLADFSSIMKCVNVLNDKGEIFKTIDNFVHLTDDKYKMKDLYPYTSELYNKKQSYSVMVNLDHMIGNSDGLDTSKLTTTYGMFEGCTSLEVIPEIDMSNVVNAQRMFYNCSKLKAVPLKNILKIRDVKNMFYFCSSLETLPEIDMSNVAEATEMFTGCSKLKSISVKNTLNLRNTKSMFSYCSGLEKISGIDMSLVYNASEMFHKCSSLVEIPVLDLSKITQTGNIYRMFEECSSLKNVKVKNVADNILAMLQKTYPNITFTVVE